MYTHGISGVLLCSRNVQDKILGQHPEMYDVTSFFQQILPNESLAQIYHSIYHQQFENKELDNRICNTFDSLKSHELNNLT